jgi:hypothetical protein
MVHSVEAARALAGRIDQFVSAAWVTRGVAPTAPADDAEFLRRIYLDVAGRIPRVWEAREFLDDPKPNKRERLIGRLLEGPDYVRHFSNVWRATFVPESSNQQLRFFLPGFQTWLQQQLQENVGYDGMAREILALPVARNQPMQRPGLDRRAATPVAFYQAGEFKPENLAASTSRLFLGVKLECAQCHDHPFARWSRKQFWELAAFYSGVKSQNGPFATLQENPDRREIKIGGTDKVVKARLLDGTEPTWKEGVSARITLANWITTVDNPFFARTAVNRIWAQFFGIGLIDPVDEAGDQNPPSHPELLDELAREFAAKQFDLRFLIRAITMSRTYQLTSAGPPMSPGEGRLFTRMAVKGLSPEQLFDSLALATGYRGPRQGDVPSGSAVDSSPRAEFLTKFAAQDKRTEPHTTILQALLLMNGKFMADATSVDRSELLAGVLEAPFLKGSVERTEALYLATLSRRPRPEELARLTKYVESRDGKSALADVFWSLLNSSEFMFNH